MVGLCLWKKCVGINIWKNKIKKSEFKFENSKINIFNQNFIYFFFIKILFLNVKKKKIAPSVEKEIRNDWKGGDQSPKRNKGKNDKKEKRKNTKCQQ